MRIGDSIVLLYYRVFLMSGLIRTESDWSLRGVRGVVLTTLAVPAFEPERKQMLSGATTQRGGTTCRYVRSSEMAS